MPATSRDFREEDLLPCLNVDQRRIGDSIVGRTRAILMWRRLLRCHSFKGVVFESDRPSSEHRIIGFGCAVFVSPEFAAAELASPHPGLNDRLIASMESGFSSVVLPDAKLRALNTHGTLDLVVLYANWLDSVANGPQRSEIQMAFAQNMLEVFSGYRLGTVLCEEIGEVIRNFREATRAWRLVKEFTGQNRGLICLTRDDALSVAGSAYAGLFLYRAPTLQLRDEDKQLLIAARNGATDSELAEALNLSVEAVKKRWRSIFDRIALKRPDLIPDSHREPISETRGPQKRHIVVAYVRDHPEELRPFENSG
jgi:DNA-binding CsgD family transcriptional regulator